MRTRRLRGIGCLGCLPFGGLLTMLLPLIIIAAIVYVLVNRPKPPSAPPPGPPMPDAGGGFCPQCGRATPPGTRYCAGCGHQFG